MELKQLFADDNAVSPVIGVILMVAITVILAAVIGTFVLGLGDQVKSSAPSASLSYDYSTALNGTIGVDITHTGGDELSQDSITVTPETRFNSTHIQSGPYTAGDKLIDQSFDAGAGTSRPIGASNGLEGGDTIRVVWQSDDGSKTNVISSSTVPSSV